MSGIIVTTPPTVELPPGSTSGSAVLPPVTYQYAVIGLPQTWTGLQTFPLGTISVQAGDVHGLSAGSIPGLAPSATIDTTNASNITSGTLPAARLPTPTPTTLGGLKSPTTTVAGNIAFYNDTTGAAMGASPVAQGGNPGNAGIYSNIANPANGYATIYNGLQFSMGTAIPAGEQFGGNAVGSQQALVATLDIASGDAAGNAGTAIAGYGRSHSAATGAVGVTGRGAASVANTSVWGGTFNVNNTSTQANNSGFDINWMSPIEIDANIWKKAAGAEPTVGNVFGIYLTGGGDSTTNQGTGYAVDKLSAVTGAKWTNGFASRGGAAVNAFVAGPTASSGNSLNSQFILLQGVNGVGGTITYQIYGDSGGDLFIRSPAAGSVVLGDNASSLLSTAPAAGGAKIQLNALSGGAAGLITNDTSGNLGTTPTGTGVQTFLGTPSSANLAAALTDEVSAAGVSAKALFGTAGNLPATATNDNAAAGNVGEYIEGILTSGSATALTTTVDKTVISISLTAGDWDVDAIANFVPAATTNITQLMGSISLVNNTLDVTAGRVAAFFFPGFVPGGSFQSTPIPNYRLSLNATTTVYLAVRAAFTVSTMTAYGIIRARRVR